MIMQPFPAKTRKRVKFMSYTKIAAIYADSEALSGQTVTVEPVGPDETEAAEAVQDFFQAKL